MYTLIREQDLSCSIEEAWNFFSDPDKLADITPPSMQFKILDKKDPGPIYEGMRLNYRVSPLFGIRFYWQTIITQVQKPFMFIDFQAKGPYKYWQHQHEFFAIENGVRMRDTVHYALPAGFIGTILHRLVVRKKLDEIFNFRSDQLRQLFRTK